MRLAFLLTIMACCRAPAQAAVVYMRDGSRVVGNVLHTGAGEVEIQTSNGVEHIPASQIEHVDYGQGGAAPAAPYSPAQPAPPPPPRRRVELEENPQTLSIHAGVAVPFQNLDYSAAGGTSQRNGDAGPLVGVQYMYQTDPHWGLGGEFDWTYRTTDDSFSSIPNVETQAWGDTIALLGLVKYRFTTSGWARPFVAAGVGADRTSTKVDATPLPGFVWADTGTGETRRVIDDARWGLATAARVGVDFRESPQFLFALELGWLHSSNRTYQATSDGRFLGLSDAHSPIDYLTFAGRWGFSFGEGSP